MYSDKQIHLDMDTIVSSVIQSEQVLECKAISVSLHVNFINWGYKINWIHYYNDSPKLCEVINAL